MHIHPILWQPSCRVLNVLWERVVHRVNAGDRDVFFAIADILHDLASHLKCLQHLEEKVIG